MFYSYFRFLLLTATVWFLCAPAQAFDARQLIKTFDDRLYQIRIVEQASGQKSSIGSGFQISADGILVTNYHVIADVVMQPDKFAAESIASNGETNKLDILAVDVIADLALVRHSAPNRTFLGLAKREPRQGEAIYSLGNPHDLGMTVVPGTYNGLTANSFYGRIHFTGAVNPGMSGGPVLNQRGRVIGVNVATAGNQIGFLVPLANLKKLIRTHKANKGKDIDLKEQIRAQLLGSQKVFLGKLMETDWPQVPFQGAAIIGEMAPFVRCWGESNVGNKEKKYLLVNNYCRNEEAVYLSPGFTTGTVEYQFSWYESKSLSPTRFYNLYERQINQNNIALNSRAEKKSVSNFVCHQDFVENETKNNKHVVQKSTLCARSYKEFPDLYDLFYISATVHDKGKGLISHFFVSGVEKSLALEFTDKFLKHVKWIQ